jgi:hypothetical protein
MTIKVSPSSGGNHFAGTDNPRHLRVIIRLLKGPLSREALDRAAGCSNGPELVAELKRRGLEVPCKRIKFIDRDGKPCRPGVYSLSAEDKRKLREWFAKSPFKQSVRGGL